MENDIPHSNSAGYPASDAQTREDETREPADESALGRAVERGLSARRATARDEVQRLVEAAFLLIARDGDLSPRVSEIVHAAGLSNKAFYRHFRSKHELLVGVLDEGIRILASYLQHRMARAASPEERVVEWVRGLCVQAVDAESARATRPFALARGELAHAFPDEVARSERQLTQLLQGALQEARDAGTHPGVDPERDARALYWAAMGWLQDALQRGEADRADARHLEAFALAALRRGADGEV